MTTNTNIERAIMHVAEMLKTRGDDVSGFLEEAKEHPLASYYSRIITLTSSHTKVFFALNKELAKDHIKEWKDSTGQDIIDTYDRKSFMIILTEKPSSTSLTTLELKDKALASLGGIMQMYLLKELQYNPSKHSLVPLHEKMTEEDVATLLSSYLLKNKFQLPAILKNDVMARYLGLKHGDVVRITHYNECSGQYYYYRVCAAR